LGGFAIGARVALLWQHNSNLSYKLASIPRHDDIVRTAGWAGSARIAGRRTVGAPKTARRIREAGSAGPPATGRRRGGAFSTLLRQSAMRASTGGVLATKSERKMLASTCLYSLYAWFVVCVWKSWEPLNEFAPNSHEIRVWSLARASLNVKVNFGGLRAVCLEKTSLL